MATGLQILDNLTGGYLEALPKHGIKPCHEQELLNSLNFHMLQSCIVKALSENNNANYVKQVQAQLFEASKYLKVLTGHGAKFTGLSSCEGTNDTQKLVQFSQNLLKNEQENPGFFLNFSKSVTIVGKAFDETIYDNDFQIRVVKNLNNELHIK